MVLNCFKKMFGIPPLKPLTKAQQFTLVSAMIAYIAGGVSIMLMPDVWNIIFGFELTADRRGYLLLIGGALMIIGFSYVVSVRGKSLEVPGQGVILVSIISRIVYVNWVVYDLYENGLITLMFGVIFSVLDTSLAFITLIIWREENEGAGVKRFLKEMCMVVNPWPTSQKKPEYAILQLLGFLQITIGQIAPSFLMYDGIGTHSEGLFLAIFAMFKIHGIFHFLGGGDCNYSFLMFALFYRVIWNIPLFLFAGFTEKITIDLTVFLVSFDVFYSLIISILLFLYQKIKNN